MRLSPRTHNSSRSVTRLIVSALTNEVGEAACPGSDLLMDWKWSESYVTLCWVNNLNWQDLMAGSDSSGWVAALSYESQFLTVFKGLRFCQNQLFSARHITTHGGHLKWADVTASVVSQLGSGGSGSIALKTLTHTKTKGRLWRENLWPTRLSPRSQHPKGCQPNHRGMCRPRRLNPLVFAFLGVFVSQEDIKTGGSGHCSLHAGPATQCKHTLLSRIMLLQT